MGMVQKKTIFQAMDEKLSAQLRLQQYQVSLAEEAKQNKEFQDRIKNLVFEVRKKAESLIASNNQPAIKAAVGMFAMNVFKKLPLSASNFNEISDKEYFHATVKELESVINQASPDERNKITLAVNSYEHLEMIAELEGDYSRFDNGKSKFNKVLYYIFYPTLCVGTIVGIPLLIFTKKVVRWAEGSPYQSFRSISTVDLAVKNIPIGFVQKFYDKPYTGKYLQLKEVKNFSSFKKYCEDEKSKASQEIANINQQMPGIQAVAEAFV